MNISRTNRHGIQSGGIADELSEALGFHSAVGGLAKGKGFVLVIIRLTIR